MMSSSSQQQDGDDRFLRDYSKALAEALLEQDTATKKISKETATKDAYIALCHDDPRVDSDEACRLLAASLMDGDYALSERLVDGIRQSTSRAAGAAVSSSTPVVDSTDEEQQATEAASSSFLTVGAATAAGYAHVAVAAFVKVPLACCQCTEQSAIERYLGSYRGPARNQQETDTSLLNETAPLVESPLLNEQQDHGTNTSEHDSLEEVWADESDPDDFEYESSQDAQHVVAQDYAMFFPELNPDTLSQPPTSCTLTELRHAVANLLIELSYSKLASLSVQQWKTLRLSDVLTQLALTLLVPTTENGGGPLMLRDEDDPACIELRGLGVQALYCLRDRAMLMNDTSVLADYLLLLQTLLGVDGVMLQNDVSLSHQPLAPASVIGMASLSALCASTEGVKNKMSMRSRIRKSLMENMEDLASVVERSSCTLKKAENETDDDGGVSLSVRFMLTLLPMLHVVTGILADGTSSALTTEGVSKSEAQIMLNSGFFRQVLLLHTTTTADNDESPTSAFARTQLLRALLVLCIQSTTLLGKYAWRVPDLSRLLSSSEWRRKHPLDCMLWMLLGESVLATSGDGGGRLRLKGAAAATANVETVESCRQSVMDSFHELCQGLLQALKALREQRVGKTRTSMDDWKNFHEQNIMEFSRFTNLLVSCPSFATAWLNSVSACGAASTSPVNDQLQEVRQAVSSMPQPAKSVMKQALKNKDEPKKTAENDKAGSPVAGVIDTNEEHVTNVKKGVKVLALLLQEGASQQGTNVSSKTD